MPYSAVWGSMAFQVWELFAVYCHTWADPFLGREEPDFSGAARRLRKLRDHIGRGAAGENDCGCGVSEAQRLRM